MSIVDYLIAAISAILAGLINALAGGGTLITFPVLLAIGLPAISANVTNTVALLPGYLGGTISQSNDLKGQSKRLLMLIPAGMIGGLIGGILLLQTGEELFSDLVPYLILLASCLLALQNPVRKWIAQTSTGERSHKLSVLWLIIPVIFAAVYGGYFGAGLSVIILAVLGFVIDDSINRLNALKQGIAFTTNVAAAVFFVFSGEVDWIVALVMAVGALLGGAIGGKVASKIKPNTLRWLVVTIGFVVGFIYLIKNLIS